MSSLHHAFDEMPTSGGGGPNNHGGHHHHHSSSNNPNNNQSSSHHHHHAHHQNHGHSRMANTSSARHASTSSPSSSCQLRGKWEILLVFLVIFSGIVLTTLAVIKAKEKRSTPQHIPAENTLLPVVERNSPSSTTSPSSSSTSLSVPGVTSSTAAAIIPLSDKVRKSSKNSRNKNDSRKSQEQLSRNRYQVERDFGVGATDLVKHRVKQQQTPTQQSSQHHNQQQQQAHGRQQQGHQLQQPQQPQQAQSSQPSPSVSSSVPYDFAADSSTLIKVRPAHKSGGGSGTMLVHYDGLPAYPGPAGKSVILPKAELTVNGAGFLRQMAVGSSADFDLTPEGSSRHTTRVSGQRIPPRGQSHSSPGGRRPPPSEGYPADPNANYISSKELMWLQQQRPDLFQSSIRTMPQHVGHVVQNYGQNHHQRMRRAALDFGTNRKNRKFQPNQLQQPENSRQTLNQPQNSGQNLYSVASKKVEKKRYGILGSGNFEIIRGGILAEEPTTTRRPLNKKKKKPTQTSTVTPTGQGDDEEENSLAEQPDNSDGHGSDGGSGENSEEGNNSQPETDGDGDSNNNGVNDENGEQPTSDEEGANDDEQGNPLDDTFEPFNLDLFGGQDPLAGFQTQPRATVL